MGTSIELYTADIFDFTIEVQQKIQEIRKSGGDPKQTAKINTYAQNKRAAQQRYAFVLSACKIHLDVAVQQLQYQVNEEEFYQNSANERTRHERPEFNVTQNL